MGVLSGGVEISGVLGSSTITLNSGNTITLSADQGNDILIDANDSAAGCAMTLMMNNDSTANITFNDAETVSINTGSNAASVVDLATTAGGNDALNIAGTSSFTADDITSGS